MSQRVILSLLLLLSVVAAENAYYVDPESVKKEEKIWTMKLKNHHEPAPEESSNPEIMRAAVTIESLDGKVLHLKIIDDAALRWEAPLYNPNPGQKYKPAAMDTMGFTYLDDPFTFEIKDPESQAVLVSTSEDQGGSLKFFDKLIELGLWYPSKKIFGYGERSTPDLELCHARENCRYTIFNADALNPLDTGEPPGGKQTYGTHPFYMILLNDGRFIGALLLNTNSQEIEITKNAGGDINLYHRMVGGIIDMYFFYPNGAESLMKSYHDLIGKPYLPPFWALGYHQCRWGWQNLGKVKDVVARFEQADIPLEVMWADIDYMHEYRDFSVDQERFGGLGDFVNDLHRRKMRWVPIVDAGLKYDLQDKYIIEGEAHHAFVLSANNKGKTFVGKVWPGESAYIDFLSPYGETLWHMGLSDLEHQVAFDGIWLDMNEASNFCNGECSTAFTDASKLVGAADPHDPTEFDNPPYVPGNRPFNTKAIDMAAYHYSTNDDEDRLFKEYNLHSLWGILEGKSTNNYLAKHGHRPFIITRSSYVGSGMHVSIWSGDNYSTWEYMRYSLINIFNFQMFGMPLSGADICGFVGDTTEELCGRWMQVGAFYPFTRNHNVIDARDQEPYVFGERVAMASRNAIRQKYSLLQYYYTKLYEISLDGGSMFSPIFFEYPHDAKAYASRNDTFMVGKSLLVAPVMYKGLTEVNVYCPNDDWYDLRSRKQLTKFKTSDNTGTTLKLPGGFDYVNVLLRGGSIIPFQDALASKVRRTDMLKYLPLELIVAPNHEGVATGTWIVDDGDSLNTIEEKQYRYYSIGFSMKEKSLKMTLLNDYVHDFEFEKFWKLSILGAEEMKGLNKACIVYEGDQHAEAYGSYNSEKKMISYQISSSTKVSWKSIKTITFSNNCNTVNKA